MKAYKFLRTGGVARFSGYTWGPTRPGPRPVVACRSGFHACRVGDLPYWLDDELWVVELAGTVEHLDFGVAAEEAWLVERLAAWPDPVAGRLVTACVERVCDRTAHELDAAGRAEEAEQVRTLSTASGDLAALAEAARAMAAALPADVARRAVHLLEYAGDAATYGAPSPARPWGEPVVVAYVAAYAAGRATPSPGEHHGPGVTLAEAERRWQARWLAGALGVS